jgi:ABC-type antimicrobial peptide transport system permease subunit
MFASKEVFELKKVSSVIAGRSPWLLLESDTIRDIVPAIADQTVITWGLRKKIGDTLLYQAESGNLVKVVLMAGIENSIFQGSLLVDEDQLKKHFPAGATPDLMLINGPGELQAPIAERLEYLLGNYGLSAIPAQYRLAAFNRVENTYLSVFMILGGLGVIIGIFGLGIVLLKTTYERKREIAVYQAIGIPNRTLKKLLVYEYLAILFMGSFAGIISAIYGLIPILDNPEQLPLLQLSVIMAVIWLTGIIWILLPTRKILSGNLITLLREE